MLFRSGFAEPRWADKHIKTLDGSYRRAKHYEVYRGRIVEIFAGAYDNIATLNMALLTQIAEWVEAKCRFERSSDMHVVGAAGERLVGIVKKLGGAKYLSGKGGANYQEEMAFTAAGIELEYSTFKASTYPQLWGPFEGGLSILDLLFNVGPAAAEIVRQSGAVGRESGNHEHTSVGQEPLD